MSTSLSKTQTLRPTPVLLIDAGEPGDFVQQRVHDAVQELQLEVRQITDIEVALTDLKRQVGVDATPPLILLGAQLKNPLVVARQLHRISPLSYLVFMADGERTTELRQSISPLSMIGNDWSIATLAGDDLAKSLRSATQSMRQRQHLRTTLRRINSRMIAKPPAGIDERRRHAVSYRFLESILDNASDAIIATDNSGIITTWNRAAERMFNLPARDAVGRPICAVAAGAWAERLPVLIARPGVGTPANGIHELQCRRLDGTVLETELAITPVCEESGRQIGLSAIVRDVTERKHDEEALRQSEERIGLIVNSSLDAIVSIDAKGAITGWNPQAEIIFGWRREDVMGLTIEGVIVPNRFREAHRKGMSRFASTGEGPVLNKRIELTALRRGGEEFPIELTISPLPLGDRYEFSAFVRDITERKRMEDALQNMNRELEHRVAERTAELARANDALERSNVELQQFAYVASHDLQSPLRSISGFVQLLQKDYAERLDQQANQWIERVVENTKRMQALIHDLLVYSRNGSEARPFAPTDTREVFDHALEALEDSIRNTGAEINHGDLPTVSGDRSQLVQLFQNLIDNGIKYRGDEPPKIHVTAEAKGGEWLFSVRDNGIGIAPKHSEKIFGIFQRLHTQHAYPGTGIGLAICRRVVHRHHGRIWVESEVGKGSVFYFTISGRQGD